MTDPFRRVRGRATGAVVLAAVAITSSGCGGGAGHGSSGPPGSKTWAQYNAEYLAEQKKLTLPPGVVWPTRAAADPTFQGAPNTFGDGIGREEADGLWYCAWERRWLADQTDATHAAADLNRLKSLQRLSKYTVSTLPQDRHIYTDTWARAALGDPALIQQDVLANCTNGLGAPNS